MDVRFMLVDDDSLSLDSLSHTLRHYLSTVALRFSRTRLTRYSGCKPKHLPWC